MIDESKEEFIKALYDNNLTDNYSNDITGYSNLIVDVFESSMSTNSSFDFQDTTINTLPARTIDISGRSEGIDVYFSVAFIEGNESYYQIMTWTLANRKYKYYSQMTNLIYSFKEL